LQYAYEPAKSYDLWRDGRAVRQSSAKACRPVRLRLVPPILIIFDKNMSFRTYVISLADATTRRHTMTQKLAALGLDFEFVDAVDGRAFDVTTHPHYDRTKRLLYFGRDLKGGEIGCLLSHATLLKKIATDPNATALILEDDAVLKPNIVDVIEKLIHAPYPWELVRFLGSPKVSKLRQRVVYDLDDVHKLTRLSTSPGGLHAYLVRGSGAQKLLPFLEKPAFPVDALVGRPWETGVAVLTVQPGMAVQDLDLESSIGDARMDKTIELTGLKRLIFPVTRGFYKFTDTIMKRVIYWGALPIDLLYRLKNKPKIMN
jgi:glycosyl transferase, family 25